MVRCDILVKKGKHINLVEVKAKSFNPEKDSFIGKRGTLLSGWADYIWDLAYY